MEDDAPLWLRKAVEREVQKDSLSESERFSQLLTVPMTIIALWFFYIHQSRPTGFFTDDFGLLESILFYGIMVAGMVPALVRFVTHRKNLARPFDIAQMVFFVIAGAYLLSRFPFDFHYFADALPSYLQPALDWVTDWIAKFVLAIGLIAMTISIPWNMMLYVYVGRHLPCEPRCGPGA